ncbi:hypothetical protein GCM10027577_01020 [Spirosoma fluminis]
MHTIPKLTCTKIGKQGISKFGDLDQIQFFIAGSTASTEAVHILEDRGIKVIIGS